MTNPDNVGGLPPQPPIDRFAYTGGSYPMSEDPNGEYVDYDDHVAAMHAYAELCRAAPAGGVAYHALNRILAVIGADGEIDSRHAAVVDAMEALRGIDGGRYQEDAPAASGDADFAKMDAVYNFLMGISDLGGVAFGERHPMVRGQFWWRHDLAAAYASIRALSRGVPEGMVIPEPMTHSKAHAIYAQAGEVLGFSARHFYCRGFNACREQIAAQRKEGEK